MIQVTNEILICEKMKKKLSESKNQEEYNRRLIDLKLYASERLAKRYMMKDLISKEMVEECIEIIAKENTIYGQKQASRMILNFKFGSEKTNEIIESIAIVKNRNDSLVNRWRKKVINRDKKCMKCGSNKNLHAHHISKWSDDPINRINLNNGITLCQECHSEEHPELKNLITSSKGDKK